MWTSGRTLRSTTVRDMPLAPVHVEYCSLCSCPPEFCHYAGCKGVALETALGKVSVSGGDGEGGAAAGASVGGEGAAAAAGGGEDGDKKLPGGKSKKKKDKMVTITRSTRNKKKMITTGLFRIQGCEVLGFRV